MLTVTKSDLATNMASNDGTRTALLDVLLCRDGMVSSDGHRLLVVPLENAAEELGDAQVTVRAAELEAIAKTMRKGEALELDAAETLKNGHVYMRAASGTTFAPARSDSKFPAYDQIRKDAERRPIVGRVAFSWRYMAELCKALAGDQKASDPDHGIELVIRGDSVNDAATNPIELRCPKSGRTALLMPMRL